MARNRSIVIDTNVLFSAVRSRRGASFRLLELIGTGSFAVTVSVPLVLEYEDVLLRDLKTLAITERDVRDLIDYICAIANQQPIFFLWRPYLPDPKDDMLLEVATAAACDTIVTFNHRDFAGIDSFGIRSLGPRDFLREIGELK